MNVFEFDKTLLERLDEAENVLQCTNSAVPASQVRGEWAHHIELQIEPAGKPTQFFANQQAIKFMIVD